MMVLLLVFNVPTNLLQPRGADGEGGISFLPCEVAQGNLVMNPHRGCLFQFPHKVRQCMRGFEFEEKVNVICRTSHHFASCSQAINGSSQIFMQAWTPVVPKHGFTLFRGKNHVVMKAEKCGRHRCDPSGVRTMLTYFRWCRYAQPPATGLSSLRLGNARRFMWLPIGISNRVARKIAFPNEILERGERQIVRRS